MRTIFLFLLLCGLYSCSSSQKEKKEDTQWKLVWSDEFNYNGLPDTTFWSYETGGNGWGNNELEYYTKDSLANAEVKDGSLNITVLKQKKDGMDYTSARLVTKGKKEFTYGKIVARAMLPAGRGLWPAIWMLGSNIGKVGWPDCGEIDIMEHVGYKKDSIFGTIHTKAYNHVIGTQKSKTFFISNPYNQYHLYSVEWSPEKIDFYLDSTKYFSFANEHKTSAEWPFDSPFFIILNVAVGGNFGGKEGVDDNVFPATLKVDYVRVYEKN